MAWQPACPGGNPAQAGCKARAALRGPLAAGGAATHGQRSRGGRGIPCTQPQHTVSKRPVMTAPRSLRGATAASAGAAPSPSPSCSAKARAAAAAGPPAPPASSNQQKCSAWSPRPAAAARTTSSCAA